MKYSTWFYCCNATMLLSCLFSMGFFYFNLLGFSSNVTKRALVNVATTNDTTATVNFTYLTTEMPDASFRNSLAMSQQIEKMVMEVGSLYRAKMKRLIDCQLSGQCPPRFLVYRCAKLDAFCGGLGDRMFKLARRFYGAFATDRVFIVDMQKPVPLSDFYDVNSSLYGNSSEVQKLVEKQFQGNNADGRIRISRGPSIETVFTSPVYRQNMEEVLLVMQRNFVNPKTSKAMPLPYELFYFIALHVIFAKPQEILQEAIDGVLKKLDDIGGDASKECRIGVHLRLAPKGGYPRGPDHPRVTKQLLQTCFLEKIIEVSKNCPKSQAISSPTPVVYIASDSNEAKQLLIENLKKAGVYATGSTFKALQLDLNFINATLEARRQVFLSTLIDWVVLTKMNELVITRSGFGEFASTFSSLLPYRRPTHRLPLNLYKDCRFEDDFYRTIIILESFTPPNGTYAQDEFEF